MNKTQIIAIKTLLGRELEKKINEHNAKLEKQYKANAPKRTAAASAYIRKNLTPDMIASTDMRHGTISFKKEFIKGLEEAMSKYPALALTAVKLPSEDSKWPRTIHVAKPASQALFDLCTEINDLHLTAAITDDASKMLETIKKRIKAL